MTRTDIFLDPRHAGRRKELAKSLQTLSGGAGTYLKELGKLVDQVERDLGVVETKGGKKVVSEGEETGDLSGA